MEEWSVSLLRGSNALVEVGNSKPCSLHPGPELLLIVRVVGSIFMLIGRIVMEVILAPTVRTFIVPSVRTWLSRLFSPDIGSTNLMRDYEGHHEAHKHHHGDTIEDNLHIIDYLGGASLEEGSFSVWLVFTGLLGLDLAAGGGHLLLGRVHDVGAGPDLVAVHLGHSAAGEGFLQPVPEAVRQDVAFFVVQRHRPRQLLLQHK